RGEIHYRNALGLAATFRRGRSGGPPPARSRADGGAPGAIRTPAGLSYVHGQAHPECRRRRRAAGQALCEGPQHVALAPGRALSRRVGGVYPSRRPRSTGAASPAGRVAGCVRRRLARARQAEAPLTRLLLDLSVVLDVLLDR